MSRILEAINAIKDGNKEALELLDNIIDDTQSDDFDNELIENRDEIILGYRVLYGYSKVSVKNKEGSDQVETALHIYGIFNAFSAERLFNVNFDDISKEIFKKING